MTRRIYDETLEEDLLTVIDDFRNFALANEKFLFKKDLIDITTLIPMVVVVGDQSSGKSSLLSAMIGQKLPVGVGTCSKCRIEVRFRKASTSSRMIRLDGVNWGPFELTEDFDIKELNDQIGQNGFNEEIVIIIEVSGPDCINLTYVDLPGFTNESDLPKRIAKSYIHRPNCLIVHVLSLGESDLVNKLSIKLVKEADPQKKRTLTVFTKTNIAAKNDLRLQQVIHSADSTGILTCSMTQSGEIISLREEDEIIRSFGLPFEHGRNKIMSRIENFTKRLLLEKKSELLNTSKLLREEMTSRLNHIGHRPLNAFSLIMSWQRDVNTILEETLSGKRTDFIENAKQLSVQMEKIVPSKIPVEVSPQQLAQNLEKLRGLGLSFTIGCEPLIKDVAEWAVQMIRDDIFKWIDSVKTLLTEMVKNCLIGDQIDDNFSSAGKVVIEDLNDLLDKEFDQFRGAVEELLTQIYTKPTLLDQARYSELVYRQRIKHLFDIHNLLQQPDPIPLIRNYLDQVYDFSPNKNSILLMEAEETKTKIEFYWSERVANLRNFLFEKSQVLLKITESSIIQKVKHFEREDLFIESPEKNVERNVLKQGLDHLANLIRVLNNLM